MANLGCPFCGDMPEVVEHFQKGAWRLLHRCKVIGFMEVEWTSNEKRLWEVWNTRAEPSQPEGMERSK